MSKESPYRFVGPLERIYGSFKGIIASYGPPYQIIPAWSYYYTNFKGTFRATCYGIDELDAYRDAIKDITHREKRYFKDKERAANKGRIGKGVM